MPDHHTSPHAPIGEPDLTRDHEQSDWLQEEEQPPRRARRLLTPLALTLTAILLLACGFIAGVLVQKGQSATGGSGLTARFAALRGTVAASGSPTGGAAAQGPGALGGSVLSGGRSAASAATVGQVAFVKGSTLYVTDTQGDTVRVKAPAGATVSKTVSSSVRSIHPGETVLVTGTTDAKGAVTAQSIRAGAFTGALGSAFTGGTSRSSAAPSSSATGEPALFGKG